MKRNISTWSLLLPLALFLIAILLKSPVSLQPAQIYILKEILIFGTILLSIPIIFHQKWASDRNVLRGLRQLFFFIFFT